MEPSRVNTEPPIAALYCRVSTEEQAKLGQSLAVQVKSLEEYAENKGYRVFDTYIDDGYSGADFSRPHLIRLREEAKTAKFDTVFATHLDRLGRDGPELLNLIYKEFHKLSVRCLFTVDGLDSFDDRDELVIYIRAQQAAEFRKKLSQRTRASKIHMAENGKWVGGAPPTGYELDRETHHLRVCPEEAKLVEKIIELSLEGKGTAKITSELNRLAFPPVTARVYLPVPRWCEVIKREKQSKSCYLRIHHQDYHDHCETCIAKFANQARFVERNGIGRSTVRRIQKQDLYMGTWFGGERNERVTPMGIRD